MAKQYKVIVNTGNTDNNKTVDVQQGAGDRGQPIRIKAQAGAKYQLQELTRSKPVGPDYVKVKRVGKDLHILFENETQASLILEDYYSEMAAGYNGVIGLAENGSFYEYIPEDPRVPGLIPELADGRNAVNVALGGAEVTPAGAAVAVAAFPLLGALGILGAGAAVVAATNDTNTGGTTPVNVKGALDPNAVNADGTPNDSGTKGDNRTNDHTPTLSGTVPAGSTATITINGQTYPVTVAPDGSWSFTQPTNLPDGTYTPKLNVTQNGVTTSADLTPFTIESTSTPVDTTAPTIAISADKTQLAAGQTSVVTFTLSEPSTDFALNDVTVIGGTLSNFQGSGTSYTATFTPTAGATSAAIYVASDRFSDAAGNLNKDGADTNNGWSYAIGSQPVPPVDTTPPTIAVTADKNQLAAGQTSVVSFTLSEASTDFTLGDVTVIGGTLSNFQGSGTSYTATFTPNAGATSAAIYVASDKFSDAAGNLNKDGADTNNGWSYAIGPVQPEPVIDTTPPTIAITSSASQLLTGQTATITFTLSEASSDFALGDVTVNGGTLSNFQRSSTNPLVYTATLTPGAAATSVGIAVGNDRFSDAAGNFNKDGADVNNATSLTVTCDPISATPDLVGPTVAIARTGSGVLGGNTSEIITFTLSEVSKTFVASDIDVVGGKLSDFRQSASNPLVYTAVFTPAAGSKGQAYIGVAAGKFTDAMGNLNTDTYASGTGYQADNLLTLEVDTSLVATPGAFAHASTGNLPTPLADAQSQAITALQTYLAQPSALTALFETFNGTLSAPDAAWTAAANDFLADFQAGTASARVELRSSQELQDAQGAFSPTGTTGQPTIYLNADWINGGATTDAIQRVLLEEYGHYIDHRINTIDTRGDEGQLFSARVMGDTLTSAQVDAIVQEDDRLSITLDGQPLLVEAAALLFAREAYFTTTKITLEQNTSTLGSAVAGVKFLFVSDPPADPYYSGNNVRGYLYGVDANNNVVSEYYGEISRLIKIGSTTIGCQFYVYPNPAAPSTGTASTTIIFGVESRFDSNYQTGSIVKTSSDPVAAALNALLVVPNQPPAAAPDTNTASMPSCSVAGQLLTHATGTVLTNDTDPDMQYTIDSSTTPKKLKPAVDALVVTSVTSSATNASAVLPANSSSSSNGSTITAQYGTLTIGADGTYLYDVNELSPALIALPQGSTVSETFIYTISDGKGGTASSTLTITINGGNNAPTAVNDFKYENEVTLNSIQATGNVKTNDSDIDTGDSFSVVQASGGQTLSGSPTTVTSAGVSQMTGTAGYTYNSVVFKTGQQTSSVGLQVYVDGVATGVYVKTVEGSGSKTVTFRYADGTDATLFLTTSSTVTFSSNGTVFVAAGAVDTLGTPSSTIFYLNNPTGTLTQGALVTGEGIASGTTVSAINGNYITLSAAATTGATSTTLGSGETLSFLTGAIYGTYGYLNLRSDGSYTYVLTKDVPNSTLVNDYFTYQVKDASGCTSTAVLQIQIQGTQVNPPTMAVNTQTITEAAVSTGTSTFNSTASVLANDSTTAGPLKVASAWTDANTTPVTVPTGTTGTTIAGQYGTLTLKEDGTYSYALNEGNATVDALRLSTDTLTETFYYRAKDGQATPSYGTSTLTLTITGTNDAPIAVVDTVTALEASGMDNATAGVNPTGNVLLNDTDVDTGDTKTVTAIRTGSTVGSGTAGTLGGSTAGTYGTLVLNADGSYTYTVNNDNPNVEALKPGDTLTDSFNYTVTDAAGGTSTATLTVTIQGANDTVYTPDLFVNEGSPYAVFSVQAGEGQALSLALAVGTASLSDSIPAGDGSEDYGPTLQYWNVATSAWATYTSGFVPVPAGGTLLVRTEVRNDNLRESAAGETFTLTATNQGGTGYTATATILDDGTGTYYPAADPTVTGDVLVPAVDTTTLLDDDRPLTVSDISVNENSPYAVFQVTGVSEQWVKLAMADGTAQPDDHGSTLQYFDGTNWVNYNPATNNGYVQIPSGTDTLLVRTTLVDNATYEGPETFTLTATNTGNLSDVGTATILDDGTGLIYPNNTSGNPDPNAALDDDRPLIVNNLTVNENSPYAVFTVTATAGETLTLALASGTADLGTDTAASTALQYFDGSSWVTYTWDGTTGNQPTLVTDTLLVRLAITDDAGYEGPETFTLTANRSGATPASATGKATIVDDGTGAIFPDNTTGATDPNAVLDDDRPLTVNNVLVNENSPYTVFTVTAVASDTVFLSVLNDSSVLTADATLGVDTAPNVGLEYFNGTSWVAYTSAGATVPATGNTLLVRLAVTDDATYEGAEVFQLQATRGSDVTVGTATIVDDGTGLIFPDNKTGNPDLSAALDDDRPVTVNNLVVNEASPYAVFTVKGTAGQVMTLNLLNDNDGTTNNAILGTDTAAPSTLQYSTDGGATWVTYTWDGSTGNRPTLSSNTLLVRLGITNEPVTPVYEGPETFVLSVTPSGGTASYGTATIVDDGTGVKYPGTASNGVPTTDLTSLNDDRGITVNNLLVNEASPYAVFTIQAGENNSLKLGLQNDNSLSTANASLGTDTAATSTLQYSLDNGATWTTYSGSAFTVTTVATDGKVLARLAITDDVPYEGAEVFLLSVQRTTDNLTVYGTATIVDDGTGVIYNANGTLDTTAVPDDDRPLGVDNLTVNEGSGYAVFTVSGAQGQQVTLALQNDSDAATANATLGTDTAATSTLEYFDGTSWQTYTSGNVTIPAGNKLFVRLAISNDTPATLEGPETFQLLVTHAIDGDFVVGTATIVDDGTGTQYDGTLLNGAPVTSTTSLDNDKPGFSVNDVTVNEGAGTLTFTVTKTGATDLPSTVSYATGSGTATSGTDFTAATGTLSFAAGVTSQTITVPITNDAVYEGNESFTVTLSGATSATITDATGVGTILDNGTGGGGTDNDAPSFSVGDVSISEGGLMTFMVTRTGDSAVSQSVDYATSIAGGNTAESGDFSAASGTLTFAPGVNTQTFTVQTTVDAVYEGAETFTVTLSNPTSGSTISDATGIGTILDDGTGAAPYASGQSAPDDDRPVLNVSGVDNVAEGSHAVFTVTLDKALEADTPITLALSDVSTEAGDYNATYVVYTDPANIAGSTLTVTSGQITLPAGTTTFYVAVQTTQDSPAVYEGAEDLRLTATFADPALQFADGVSGNLRLGATANDTSTIKDDGTGVVYGQNGSTTGATPDNDKPVLTIGDATVEEGSAAAFTVSLDKATEAPWEVSFTATPVTAEAGDITTPLVVTYVDSSNVTQTLTPDVNGKYTVPAGVTTLSVSVPTTNDNVYEGPETFTLSANVTDPAITDTDTGTATIKDDGTATDGNDADTTVDNDKPVLTIGDVTVEEGSAAVFTVSLDKATEAPWEVSFTATPVTAESGDITTPLVVTYTDGTGLHTLTADPTSGKYTVPAGVTTLSVSVPTTSDNVYEGPETFTLSANVTDPAITDTDTGTATIKDDGTATDGNDEGTTIDNDKPVLTVSGVDNVSEGSHAVFTVTLDKAIEGATPITLALSDVSTEAGDYSTTYVVYTNPANIAGSTLTVTSNQITLPPNTTTFYVAVQTTQDSPAVYEGAEDLRLTATFADPALQFADGVSGTERVGASDNDTSTLQDDGTGTVYGQDGLPIPNATPDNDMAYIDVTGYGPVNEGSPYAMFTVKAAANDSLVLSLGNTAVTTDRDASISGFTPLEYSIDGGKTWTPYTWNGTTGDKPTVPASETVYVRVTISAENETTYEGPETFVLQATSVLDNTVTDSATTTIVDDGSGSIYDGTITGTTPAPTAVTTGLDDDRPVLSINDVVAEEGSAASFTVSLDNATLTPWGVSFSTALGSAEATDITGPLSVTYTSGGQTYVLTPTAGVYTVPAGVTTLSVSVPTTNDNVYEGAETFTLSASVTDPVITATDTGTATIKDDGTATDGNDVNTTIDNDLPTLTVAGVDNVSEGSYAVFTVTLDKAIEADTPIDLALADVTTESGDFTTYTVYTDPNDISGSTLTVTANRFNLPAGAQTFYVAVKTASDAPAVYEGAESFSLTATFAAPALQFDNGVSGAVRAGATATDTSTIVDDGSGVAYANTGLASGGSPDNDLSISVTAHEPVNEGSTWAMFTVTASAGDSLSLALSNTAATTDRDATLSGFTTIEYSVDGSTWVPYTWNGSTGDKPTVPSDGVVQVRVNVSSESDSTYEGPETFVLTATSIANSAVTANDVSTIVDDGTGSKYDGTLSGTSPVASNTGLDNDKPSFSVGDVSISEGGLMTFTVTRTGDSAVSQSVDYATSIAGGNTAELADLAAASGLLTFAAGVSTQTFTVQTAVDAVYEGAETFTVTLSNPTSGSTIADATGIGTILDDGTGPGPFAAGQTTPDNDKPVLSIGDATVEEGSAAVFSVSLDKATEAPWEVSFTATPVTAEAGDITTPLVVTYVDGNGVTQTLSPTSGKYTVPAGITTLSVSVPTTSDNVYEGPETFTLSANVTDPAITDSDTGTGTIKDDGTATDGNDEGTTIDNDKPTLTIGDVTVEEGSAAVFAVSLDKATEAPWQVSFSTTLGTAEAADLTGPLAVSYQDNGNTMVLLPVDGIYTVPAGVTTLSVSVPSTNDNIYEGPETFTLSANVIDPAFNDTDTGLGTIKDDGTAVDGDDPGTAVDDDRPSFSVGDVSISEGGLMTFTVTRTGDSAVSQSVDYATSIAGGNTAESGDFSAASGTLTFAPGVNTQTFTVQSTVDAVYEGAETFTVTLSNPTSGSTIADATGIGTILDDGTGTGPFASGQTTPDNDKPVLSIGDVTVEEGSAAVFSVSLDKATEAPWEVSFTATPLTAESGDITTPLVVTYVDGNGVTQTLSPTSGKYTVPAGITTLSVSVPTTSDNVYEGPETFTLSANVTDPAITDTDTGTATIKDDGTATDGNDAGTTIDNDKPVLTVSGVDNVSEGSHAVFTVTLDKAIEGTTPITLALSDVSTEAGDYSTTYVVYTNPANIAGSTLTVSSNQITLPAGTTTFYVAVQTTQDSPAVYEGAEDLRLTATFADPALQYANGVSGSQRTGASASDTSTIKDDGTGTVYGQNGSPTPNAMPDNDRDTTPPTIAISSNKTALAAGDTSTITFSLSEVSLDFHLSDVAVSGGTLSNFSGSGTTYTATFTAGLTGDDRTVSVGNNAFSDASGNFNADGADSNNRVTMSGTVITPTIAITASKSMLVGGEGALVTFMLSEPSTDFSLADVTVVGGRLSNFQGTGTTYTATFTPSSCSTNGFVVVSSNKFSNASGVFNQDGLDLNNAVAFNSVASDTDTAQPTIAILSDHSSLQYGETTQVTFLLSHNSTDFNQSDVLVTGGTLSNFQGSGAMYTATFTPAAGVNSAMVFVDSGKFRSAAGTVNQDGLDTNNALSLLIGSHGCDDTFNINLSDVLAVTPSRCLGQYILKVEGDANDTVNLMDAGGSWTQAGTVRVDNQAYNLWTNSGNSQAYLLTDIDIHTVNANVH